jgi:hypothetical protein
LHDCHYKERTCVDLNGCLPDNIEVESCSINSDTEIERTKWCNEDYLNIYEGDKLVARVKESEISKFNKINKISYTDKLPDYCSYCFDGIKNYDEEEIDCGGSCPDCVDSTHLTIILNITAGKITGFNGTLIYNGTSYNTTAYFNSTYGTLTTILQTPSINSTDLFLTPPFFFFVLILLLGV